MPIRKDLRWFYPIDWALLSRAIRFGRAGGRCERCRRPHERTVDHLSDGRWFDQETGVWRNGRGRRVGRPAAAEWRARRRTRVVLATAHLDHDVGNSRASNLKALCQRCHLEHDRPEHRRRARITVRRRYALGDLFLGPYRAW